MGGAECAERADLCGGAGDADGEGGKASAAIRYQRIAKRLRSELTQWGTLREVRMAAYIVNSNAQSNGDHEVHKTGCSYMPAPQHCVPLGEFPSCHGAVAKAKLIYKQSNGCAYCSSACNTG